MKWKGRRSSTNVSDKRGERVTRTAGGTAILGLVVRTFGIKGVLAYRLIFLVFVFLGAILPLKIVWDFGDLALGLMTLPTLLDVMSQVPVEPGSTMAQALDVLSTWDYSTPTGLAEGWDAGDDPNMAVPPDEEEMRRAAAATVSTSGHPTASPRVLPRRRCCGVRRRWRRSKPGMSKA